MTTTRPAAGAVRAPAATPENPVSNEIVRATPIANNLPDMVRYAEHLASADLLPKQFANRPANVLWAMEYGRTLGITPIAALNGIHVIEGKPSASSALIGGLVRQAGHKLRVKGDDQQAVAQIIRADDPDWTYEVTWTLERAAQAGLCEIKNGKAHARDYKNRPTAWEKYPAAMLKARAITEVARDACEDVLFGLHYTPEELGAYVDQDGNPVDAPVQQLRVVQADPVRDFVAEARAAATADEVRGIYRDAAAAKLPRDVVDQIAEIGREKAMPSSPANEAEPVDAELVEDDERAMAADALREAALAVGIAETLEQDFHGSYGVPIGEATAEQLREMTDMLRRAA